ncbi:hypothetical protein DNAM5_107 [Haloarcula californiae tailed virus 1]|uniref:Uncharacterized protein n=1 Tax=Haloarcula californiae tailed virus 1 TaxID=1273746 RepID=R4TI14_9CAUD|nr:hypothetical protein M202_gp112 [Haloarcula californiae tailed virus 1]AGM11966.1 hypothetical protein DNAM5_107 [Haloarcula californiae tailed virus 1]
MKMQVDIGNYHKEKKVGTIDDEGNLETDSKALRGVAEPIIEEGVYGYYPFHVDGDDGETHIEYKEFHITPGTTGFLREFFDDLPSPFDCDMDVLRDLPTFDPDAHLEEKLRKDDFPPECRSCGENRRMRGSFVCPLCHPDEDEESYDGPLAGGDTKEKMVEGALQSLVSKEWVADPTDEAPNRWTNTETGEHRYQERKPGSSEAGNEDPELPEGWTEPYDSIRDYEVGERVAFISEEGEEVFGEITVADPEGLSIEGEDGQEHYVIPGLDSAQITSVEEGSGGLDIEGDDVDLSEWDDPLDDISSYNEGDEVVVEVGDTQVEGVVQNVIDGRGSSVEVDVGDRVLTVTVSNDVSISGVQGHEDSAQSDPDVSLTEIPEPEGDEVSSFEDLGVDLSETERGLEFQNRPDDETLLAGDARNKIEKHFEGKYGEEALDAYTKWRGDSYTDNAQEVSRTITETLGWEGDIRNDVLEGGQPSEGAKEMQREVTALSRDFFRDTFGETGELSRALPRKHRTQAIEEMLLDPDADSFEVSQNAVDNWTTAEKTLDEFSGSDGMIMEVERSVDEVAVATTSCFSTLNAEYGDEYVMKGIDSVERSDVKMKHEGRTVNLSSDISEMDSGDIGTLARVCIDEYEEGNLSDEARESLKPFLKRLDEHYEGSGETAMALEYYIEEEL